LHRTATGNRPGSLTFVVPRKRDPIESPDSQAACYRLRCQPRRLELQQPNFEYQRNAVWQLVANGAYASGVSRHRAVAQGNWLERISKRCFAS
jgi:hypothetical protein